MSVKTTAMKKLRPHVDVALPTSAMILAAGLGTRMRPLTDDKPKALVEVGGLTLLDRILRHIERTPIQRVVINQHYKAEVLADHLNKRTGLPEIILSPESELLDTGGGVKNALPHLGQAPFFVMNTDVVWQDGLTGSFSHLAQHWDEAKMDVLLLLVRMSWALGITDQGDFTMDPSGVIGWRPERRISPYGFAGIQMVHPRAFEGSREGAFSMRDIWNKAMDAGRAYGCLHEGRWAHVGTPDAIAPAEQLLA